MSAAASRAENRGESSMATRFVSTIWSFSSKSSQAMSNRSPCWYCVGLAGHAGHRDELDGLADLLGHAEVPAASATRRVVVDEVRHEGEQERELVLRLRAVLLSHGAPSSPWSARRALEPLDDGAREFGGLEHGTSGPKAASSSARICGST